MSSNMHHDIAGDKHCNIASNKHNMAGDKHQNIDNNSLIILYQHRRQQKRYHDPCYGILPTAKVTKQGFI